MKRSKKAEYSAKMSITYMVLKGYKISDKHDRAAIEISSHLHFHQNIMVGAQEFFKWNEAKKL